MATKYGIAVANAVLDAFESAIGTSPILRIYQLSGAEPANCAAAISGTVLAEMTLPSDWMSASISGSKNMAGTWQDLSANATGTANFYRLWDSTGTTCVEQGTVTLTGLGGDMTVDNVNFALSQVVTVTTYVKSMPV